MNRGARHQDGGMTAEHAEILRVAARVARAGGDAARAARATGAVGGRLARIMQAHGFVWDEMRGWPDEEFQPAPAPVARPCITWGCEHVVASTGPHHRMCHDCRKGAYPGQRRADTRCA